MRGKFVAMVVFCLLAVLLPNVLSAQLTTSTIYGRVTDASSSDVHDMYTEVPTREPTDSLLCRIPNAAAPKCSLLLRDRLNGEGMKGFERTRQG
jgi:hypothetical protein